MNLPREGLQALVLTVALAVSACAPKGSAPAGGQEHPKDAPIVQAPAEAEAPLPALWEAVDKKFTGCAGG